MVSLLKLGQTRGGGGVISRWLVIQTLANQELSQSEVDHTS